MNEIPPFRDHYRMAGVLPTSYELIRKSISVRSADDEALKALCPAIVSAAPHPEEVITASPSVTTR